MGHKLLKSTAIVFSMTLLSRIFGFIRDLALATVFGAGPAFDAFVIAFKIPNFMRRLFGEGAFSQAFVPVLSAYRIKNTPEETQIFINHIAGCLGLAVLVIVALAEIMTPLIVWVFAPGFAHTSLQFSYTTHLLRITLPYLFFVALMAFSGAVLNTFSRFAIPAFTPVLLNIAMIIVAWFWAPHASIPIYTLAWGVFIGGLLQLLFQLPYLHRLKVLPMPSFHWRHPGVMRVLTLMLPALFGVSVAQISLLVDNFFASFLPAGSISWLYYSDRMTYLPLGLIGVGLATVVLPSLSRAHSAQALENYSKLLDWALRLALFIAIPSAAGLFILSGPLLATLIYHGAFTADDVRMTQESLWAFSVGLPGFILVKLLASAFYSRQNLKVPVKIAAVAMILNIILNLLLIKPLAHAGLALSTTIASLFNAGALWLFLGRSVHYRTQLPWLKLGLQILFATAMMAIVIVVLAGPLSPWLGWSVWKRSVSLLLIIIVGMVTYGVALWISGVRLSDLQSPSILDE